MSRDPEYILYECCQVMDLIDQDTPCWMCGGTSQAVLLAHTTRFKSLLMIWSMPRQIAARRYI